MGTLIGIISLYDVVEEAINARKSSDLVDFVFSARCGKLIAENIYKQALEADIDISFFSLIENEKFSGIYTFSVVGIDIVIFKEKK